MAAVVLSRLLTRVRRILSSAPFTKYLLATNMVASVAIDACGDMLAQKLVEKSKNIDWERNRRMMAVSMVLSIPNHYWYIYLDKWFPLSSRKHVVKKVLLDTFVGGPAYFVAFYLGNCTGVQCWCVCVTAYVLKLLLLSLRYYGSMDSLL